MAVNTLSFTQIATVMNAIHSQATGVTSIAATNTADFVTQGIATLATGFDTVSNAISQVLSRTIFSQRPYSAKFKSLEVSEANWGNHVRKISIADSPLVDHDGYKWPVAYDSGQSPADGNGQSVDPFTIHKPDFVQTNFYGKSVYEYGYTIARQEMEQAFKGPDEMARWISMIVGNRSDRLEQAREEYARSTLVNLIGAVIAEADTNRVIHLLTEYNTATGLTLTATSVYQPANFAAFMRWVYSRVAAVASLMTERSELFQTVINSKHIMRHTPYEDMRVFLAAPDMYRSEMMALSDTYHDNYLKFAKHETVNYWQSIKAPNSINITAGYIDSSGAATSSAVTETDVFGVICDREAAGTAVTQMWSEPAINARAGYTTFWDHATLRSWNDMTEKAVVLLLD